MTDTNSLFTRGRNRPLVIAGPCVAESYELMEQVAGCLVEQAQALQFDLIFKASFDKANRTSITSYRGPGWSVVADWFVKIQRKYGVPIITDVHECHQVVEVATVCDAIQIPAFLSRQTDLIIAAVKSGKPVNVKKGQFMAPENAMHIAQKVRSICELHGIKENLAITERGASFGYGDLVVDMRSFPIIASAGVTTIFDVTHSLQRPSAKGINGEETGGLRMMAPILARAAAATGYLDGFFLETHPDPAKAKSDATTQLPLHAVDKILGQLVRLWQEARRMRDIDVLYQ